MSNKKSRKLVNILLSAMMLLGINAVECDAADSPILGKNGVSYVLLSSDFSSPGVYRYNNQDGSVRDDYATKNDNPKFPLFGINTIEGKVSGLAANQENNVFLLSAIEGGGFIDAEPGWLPTGIKFDDNSSIYVSAAKPNEGGATDYIRSGCPHGPYGSKFPSNDSSLYVFWYKNVTLNGNTYKYVCRFNGPVGVKFLNGSSGLRGTPIWDGTYTTGGISTGAAIKHPTDERKIILPSHFGALSYYLYGTKNEPAIQGLPMNGSNGEKAYIFTDTNGAGYFTGDSNHRAGTMFGCIVKRFYQKRENSLNLYSGNDKTSGTNVPTNQTMSQTQSNVLKTVDVKVREAYGKLCGDNCIDGGEIQGGDVETALSTVTVVTSTTGNRYGFNPLGVYRSADTSDQTSASLRVVKTNGNTQTIDLSTNEEGTVFSSQITNKAYLDNQKITPSEIRTIGISSKFESDLDYIYGSAADYFVVQDSWWGKGGIAYEYYKGNDETPGKVVKIDYMNNDGQTESDELGDLTGKVDAIAIDGDGYLYALKTEESPSDKEMEGIDISALPSIEKAKVGNEELEVSYSGWKRDITSIVNGETQNDGTIDVADIDAREGDYKIATVKQKVYKAVKRYPQATGSLGSEEDRGTMFAGYDTWTNNLKKSSNNSYTWDYPIWRQEEGTRTSDMLAELAVVNVADTPVAIEGTPKHYITVTGAKNSDNEDIDYTCNQVIGEENKLTFKVEGYKPVVGGQQRYFKDIGSIDGTNYANVKLNSIPAEDGTYAHDEDGDENKSGFPSSMFEATGFETKVTWKIAQVEDTTAVPLASAKLVSKIETKEGEGDYKELTYPFNQPGRYIIQAEVTYNYFNNLGQSGIRPQQLKVSQASFTTEPKLVQVYANALKLNQSPSYITNIKMEKVTPSDNNNFGITGDSSGSTYDAVEGLASETVDIDAGKFGALKISFDAQFVREVENNTTGNLQTYDGIGVWDYQYYKNLYTEAKTQMAGIIVPTIGDLPRAYNHIGDGDPATAYNPNVYNPGKVKGSVTGDYTAGTKVSGSINYDGNLDKQFIQWALYLRPVSPQGDVSTEANAIYERGSLIESGTCATATFTPIGDEINRKYKVSFTIDKIDSKINTPRDPRDYTIDLEIIYPRVSWLNNDLGANLNDGHNYYSSIVPYSPVNQTTPIHVLSKLNLNSAGNKINQSYKIEEGSLYADDKQPYFTLCVRDKETPGFSDNTSGLPFIQTTGEPSIAGTFKYQVIDNNPYLSITKFDNTSARKITEEELKDAAEPATNIIIQDLIDNNKFLTNDNVSYYENNIRFTKLDSNDVSAKIYQTSDKPKFSDDTCFCATDSWRLWIDFDTNVTSISPQTFTPQTNQASVVKVEQLSMENWVGTLKYAVTGKFYDGLGKDGNYTTHYLYDSDFANKPGYPQITDPKELEEIIPAPAKEYLTRIDNDPPSIQVDLVSQSDNRRWVYKLIENVNDIQVSKETGKISLAPSTLAVEAYNLSTNTKISNIEPKQDIPGTTAYTKNVYDYENKPNEVVGTMTVKVESQNSIAEFRRASRLLINVDIFDNCGYLPLQAASIKVDNLSTVNGGVLLDKPIKCGVSHDELGKLSNYKNKPRGVFTIDLPMQVDNSINNQLKITVYAKDNQGNERELIIPVKLVESTFETRVLETKEERRD